MTELLDFWVIIPARYASTRLPGKPLLDIAGHPMLWHVYTHAIASGASRVIIATDDARIYQAAQQFGATVCMTANTHRSGTDRIAEAAQYYGADPNAIIVNVQGDEPLLPPTLIRQVAEALVHSHADMATLCEAINNPAEVWNPHIVKVVCDQQRFALYFSRAPIPWLRDEFAAQPPIWQPTLHFRHIGLYAYRAAYLSHYTQLPICPLEQVEALEQLRVLYNRGKIYVAQAVESTGLGVDTPEDLAKIRQYMENHHDY